MNIFNIRLKILTSKVTLTLKITLTMKKHKININLIYPHPTTIYLSKYNILIILKIY